MSARNRRIRFIVDSKFERRMTRSFYDGYYMKVTTSEMRWRDFGAIEKCRSILELCKGLKFDKVVEIGAGLCNILSRLDKMDFAPELYAMEVSPSVVRFIRERVNIRRLKAVYLLDTSNTSLDDDTFDLGILSHVLEHVKDPASLLSEALRICKYVVVEVPLEDCLSINMHSRSMEWMGRHRRRNNPIGHINFFGRQSARKLVGASKGIVLKERMYRSWRIHYMRWQLGTIFQLFRSILFHLIFRVTGSALVGTHYAMLTTASRKNHFANLVSRRQ